jgi:hypothetical protein
MPHMTSRCCIHSGDRAEGSRPVTVRSTSRSTPESGSTSPGCPLPSIGSGSTAAGSVNATPYAVAASRATPRIDRQYPRSGVTAMSSTSSRRPSSSTAGAPTSGCPSSTRMPVWSSPTPSSRDEQIIPSLTWPYVRRAVMAKPPGSVLPGRATTTRSSTAKLRAPQTMPRGSPSPTSTWHQRTVLPLEAVSSSKETTRPTTTGPVMSWPGCSTVSTSSPAATRRSASARPVTSAGRSACSRSQDSGARIRAPSRTAA